METVLAECALHMSWNKQKEKAPPDGRARTDRSRTHVCGRRGVVAAAPGAVGTAPDDEDTIHLRAPRASRRIAHAAHRAEHTDTDTYRDSSMSASLSGFLVGRRGTPFVRATVDTCQIHSRQTVGIVQQVPGPLLRRESASVPVVVTPLAIIKTC